MHNFLIFQISRKVDDEGGVYLMKSSNCGKVLCDEGPFFNIFKGGCGPKLLAMMIIWVI